MNCIRFVSAIRTYLYYVKSTQPCLRDRFQPFQEDSKSSTGGTEFLCELPEDAQVSLKPDAPLTESQRACTVSVVAFSTSSHSTGTSFTATYEKNKSQY